MKNRAGWRYSCLVYRDDILGGLRLPLLLLGLITAMASPAWAQKTDVVTLVNGDRLTCEVKLLDQGQLQVSTDDLGTVNIEWDNVAAVKAARTFRVETATGLRLLGQLATSRAGSLDVVAETGTISLDLNSVVYITPIASGFWSKLDGSLDLGASYTQSSGVAQYNFNTSVTYRRANLQVTASGSSYFTYQENAEDSSRHAAQLFISRLLKTRSLWLVQGGFERNRDLGYDLRSTASAGLGQYLVRSNRAIFGVGGGLSVNQELPVDGDAVENLEAMLSVRQSYFTYDYPKTTMSLATDFYPSLSQWGRVRVELNSSIKREVIHDFTVGFTVYDSYDNRPPTAEARKNDVGLTLTIGWTF